MSFDTDPIIDKNAILSEESINAIRPILSKKNGFIILEVNGTDDYGTDLIVQLVEDTNPLAFTFPIQVKSSHVYNKKIIKEKSYLSSQFKTGRLNSLSRHIPTTGVVVFYDGLSKQIVFDFCYEILNRILQTKKSNKWKEQEKVTIHIPVENDLNMKVKSFHTHLLNMYNNHKMMHSDHGKNYELPTLNIDSRESASNLLGINGFYLSKGQYDSIIFEIEKLSLKDAKRPEISYLASISYYNAGDINSSNYFFQLCNLNRDQYRPDELESLDFWNLWNNFSLGKFSKSEMKSKLNEIKLSASHFHNAFIYELNQLRFQVQEQIKNKSITIGTASIIEKAIKDYQSKAKGYSDNIYKSQALIIGCSTLSHVVTKALFNFQEDSTLLRYFDITYTSNNRKRDHMEIRRIIIFLNDLICQEIRKCQDSDNEYLKAGCYQLYSDTVFNQTLILGIVFNPTSLFELKIPQNKLQDYYKEEFRTAFKLILIAYNTYTSLNLDKKAKDSIQLAHKLYRNAGFYKIDLADIVDITVFNKIVNHHNIDMLNYEIGQESNSDNKIEKQELSELLAKSFMKHHNMPPDRYQNVKLFTDIYLYLHDEDNNPKKGLGLSCNQNIHDSNSFVGKPYFLIHQNSIDKLIAEGSDVHEIIKNIENHISP